MIAISGPTGSGKTAVACELARRISGEIITCDSMQIYRGLDVGTAKASEEERSIVPHHMLDILDPDVTYSVADYVSDARKCIEDVRKRDRFPIVCGGTGMYVDALLRSGGFQDEPKLTDEDLAPYREMSTEELFDALMRTDPEYAAMIPNNSRRRAERALALFMKTGTKVSERAFFRDLPLPEGALLTVLNFKDRSLLYDRINRRVDIMAEEGILKEALYVYENRERFTTAAQAIGYKEFFPYFEKTASLEECIETLKRASRNYAKRQLTWFRKENDIFEIFVDELKKDRVATIIEEKARSMKIIP
ncbi:MAG: tRNA (adenosine(37)-N6)-dimethylallyltransferase MiaA [Oscillospiraceae bacterium]|nr:tRNA (adenosine(37)-N6)-dimethylallyltransferase MiaA [Oscillospiraceae bacterium]